MKKTKRTILLALTGCAFVATSLAAVACGGSKKYDVVENGDEYQWTYDQPFVGEMDADMKIDGKLTEERWKDKNWIEQTERGITMRATATYTEKGLYIAATAKDPRMIWNGIRDYANNSSFRFYVISNQAEKFYVLDCVNFYVDEITAGCRQQTRFTAKAVKSKDEEGNNVLTAEFFSTWEDLHFTVKEETGMPDFARIVPAYRYVEAIDSQDNGYVMPTFCALDSNYIYNSVAFDENGYINGDVEGAELGNAKNGFTKTDAWDTSNVLGDENGENKSVRALHGERQAIFFKDIYSDRYAYSFEMKLEDFAEDHARSGGGACDMKSATEFNALRVDMESFLSSGKKTVEYSRLDFYVDGFNITYLNSLQQAASDTVKLTVIKDNAKYYYIFNDKYAASVQLPWLNGKTCPGLFAYNGIVEFTNWSATDYSGAENDAAFKELLDGYAHAINVPLNVSGGTVSVDKIAVPHGSDEDVTLTVRANRGYILSDIIVNGQSKYDEWIPKMENGEIVISDIKESMKIDVVFSAMPTEGTIRVMGTAKRTNGSALAGLEYVAADDSGTVSIYGSASSSGVVDLALLRAGTYEIDGRTVTTDGKYTLTFSGEFDPDAQRSFVIDTSKEEFADINLYRHGDFVLDPYRALKMTKNADGSISTTTLQYDKAFETTYFYLNETYTGNFAVKMTIDAHIDKWPCYGLSVRDESGASVEVYAAGPSYWRLGSNLVFGTQEGAKAPGYLNGICEFEAVYLADSDLLIVLFNGKEITRIRAGQYIDGTAFSIGVVSMRPGADGSYEPITPENPLATFKNIRVEQTYRVELPNGATISVNGEEIADGQIPVWSNATVKIPVSGSSYTILVNGNPVESVNEGGFVTAEIVIKEDCTIECKENRQITGSVTVKDGLGSAGDVTVTAVSTNGNKLFEGKAKDGSFTAMLAEGTYYLTAESDNLVSKAYRVEVTEDTGVAIELSNPKIGSGISGFDTIGYDRTTGNYIHQGKTWGNGGLFAGAEISPEEAFVLRATVPSFRGAWCSAGFTVATSKDETMRIVLRRNGGGYYDIVNFVPVGNAEVVNLADAAMKADPFTQDGAAELVLVYNGGSYTFFVNGVAVYGKNGVFADKNHLIGLFCESDVTFTEWGYELGTAAVEKYIGKTLTLSGGITASVNGQAVPSGGKVLLGDTVTVSFDVAEGQSGAFSVDGNQITTIIEGGKATATFKVTGNHSVAFASMYAVSGTVNAAQGLSSTGDITVIIVNEAGEKVYEGATESGVFSASLIPGAYTVTATSDNLVSSARTFTVTDAAVADLAVTLNKARLITELEAYDPFYKGLPAHDGKTGNYTGAANGAWGGYFANASVAASGAFVISATVPKFEGNWHSAGFAVKSDAEQSMRLVVRRNGDSASYDLVNFLPVGNPDVKGLGELSGDPFTQSGAMQLMLIYNNGTFVLFVNNVSVYTAANLFADAEEFSMGLFCEQAVTFADWEYELGTAAVEKYIGKTLTLSGGITASVIGQTVTNGKVLLGDTVTVSLDVAEGQSGTFSLGNTQIDTTVQNGKATASFKVTGDHSVTFASVYAVSGNVTAAEGLNSSGDILVVIANEAGEKVYEGTAQNGAFTTSLIAGKYYATATSDNLVSNAREFTVTNKGVSGIALVLNKLKLTGAIVYNPVTGKAESNVMYGNTSQIAGAVVNSNAAYMLTATVEKFVCAWASAGFEVKFAEKQYRFVLRYNGTKNCYDMVAWHNTATDQPEIGKAEYASDPFTKTGNTAELALIYKDGAYYFMINGEIFHTVTEADNEQVQLGLYCEQQQEIEKITFTAWDYSAEQSAYAKYLEKTLTLSGGITASVNGQAVTNGKVLLGDTVTVSLDVAEGQSGTFSLGNTQIDTAVQNGKATASFKVTGDHSVTFASVYAVSGNAFVDGKAELKVVCVNADNKAAFHTEFYVGWSKTL